MDGGRGRGRIKSIEKDAKKLSLLTMGSLGFQWLSHIKLEVIG